MMIGYGERKITQQELCDLFIKIIPNRESVSQSTISKTFRETERVRD